MMEEQVTQIPAWGVPFLICLELVILYVTARIGRLILTCQNALDWVQHQKSSSIFDAQSFTEGVSNILNEIKAPIWNVVAALGVNIYCIVLLYLGNTFGVWLVMFAVYFNTNAIVSLFNAIELTNKIINTVVEVEQFETEQRIQNSGDNDEQ